MLALGVWFPAIAVARRGSSPWPPATACSPTRSAAPLSRPPSADGARERVCGEGCRRGVGEE